MLFQTRSDQKDQRLLTAAQELDVLVHAEPANLDKTSIQLTTYERNARKLNLSSLFRICCRVVLIIIIFSTQAASLSWFASAWSCRPALQSYLRSLSSGRSSPRSTTRLVSFNFQSSVSFLHV